MIDERIRLRIEEADVVLISGGIHLVGHVIEILMIHAEEGSGVHRTILVLIDVIEEALMIAVFRETRTIHMLMLGGVRTHTQPIGVAYGFGYCLMVIATTVVCMDIGMQTVRK